MTLEVAPASGWITYDEAILYCFFCNHNGHKDWRMPTKLEWKQTSKVFGWHQVTANSTDHYGPYAFRVTPVRTNND